MRARTRRALPGRRGGPVLAAVAAGLTSACTPATAPVQVAAATAAMPGTPWTSAAPQLMGGYPDLPVAQSTVGGLQIPQPPRPTHVGRVPMPPAAYGTPPTLTPPTATCGGSTTPRRIVPGATPGVGSATATWLADGSSDVQGYRLSAVSQTLVYGAQPDPAQQTVGQLAGCAPVTATLTGLTPGTAYVLWLEERTLDPRTGVVRFVQVGTSEPVVIPG